MELFLVNFPHKNFKMLQKCTTSAFPLSIPLYPFCMHQFLAGLLYI